MGRKIGDWQPTHEDQARVIVTQHHWLIPVQSLRDATKVYTVKTHIDLDTGIHVPAHCTCPNGRAGRRNCYHLEMASRIMRTRRLMAMDLIAEIAEGAKLAGWTKAIFCQHLRHQQHLHSGCLYQAALAVERVLLHDHGIQRAA